MKKFKINVLVVGGAGYIGGAVTDILMERNIPFTVYDKLLYEHQYFKPVDFIYGDVRDTKKLKKLLPKYTHVIWLAAIVGDAACEIRPELTIETNQDAIKWLSENYNGRIIFTSTCSVYGQNDSEVDENSFLNPLSLYAKTKVEAEKFLKNKNSLIFRLGTVFGVSDTYSRLRMDLVVNYMTANAITKGKLSVFGGTQWRPLIHVYNVAEAIVNNLEKPITGIYNLTTLNYQIKDLAKEISKITGCEIEYVEQKFEDQRNYHVSTKKAEKEDILNFKKIYTIADGAKQIYDLIKQKRVKYTENDIYFNEKHITNLNNNGELK
ncbi:MAG: NAD(P)-dependent oxidoreductase [Candidatus Pacebacteria bacterium]|nr:NAD(P)-dependent oxidoreductase [Candidatus Paceibacterota bacterium]